MKGFKTRMPARSRNKYHAKKLDIGGLKWDSKKEFQRWRTLCLLEESGEIEDLRRQVKFQLIPTQRDSEGKLVYKEVSYYADFVYVDRQTGKTVVEDVKGYKGGEAYKLFRLKAKMLYYKYKIQIKEI